MFDRRLVNLSGIDSDAELEGTSGGGGSGSGSGGNSRWQPLTTVSGDLVEQVSGGVGRGSGEVFFDNVEVSKLITELESKYEQEERLALSSSSSVSSVESNSNALSYHNQPNNNNANNNSSSNFTNLRSQNSATNPLVTSPKHQTASGLKLQTVSSFSAGRDGRDLSNQNAQRQTQSQNKRWRPRLGSSKSSAKYSFDEATATDRDPIVAHHVESEAPSFNEHQDSFYSNFLESVMAEIEDNQNFLDNEDADRQRKLSQHSYHRGNQSQPQTLRTPLSKTITSNMSQVRKFSHSANVSRSPKGTTAAFTFQSPGGSCAQVLKSNSAKKLSTSEESQRNFYLNNCWDDSDHRPFKQDKLASPKRANFVRMDSREIPEMLELDISCVGGDGDPDYDEVITSHPAVQALLSEEKGKRWALLKSLYEREASLEKQIQDLQNQLKEQTSLSNHFKRMQHELVMSHTEKENMWEKERTKLIEKLKSGHNKMKMLSKLILLLQKEVKEKDEQLNGLMSQHRTVDQNRNEVYKYQVLNENELSTLNLASDVTSFSSGCNLKPKVDLPSQSNASKSVEQSNFTVFSESKSLIDEDLDSTLHNSSDGRSLNANGSSNVGQSFWNGNGLTSEMSHVKKLVTNCKLNAEKQCRMLKQIFPEASKSCSKQLSSKMKQKSGSMEKDFTFEDANYDSYGDDDAESDREANNSDDADEPDHYKVYKSKSFSASLGLDKYTEPPQPSSYLSSHISSSVSAISSTIGIAPDSSALQAGAAAMNQPGGAPSGDPFDLDLKVKYCSSENLPHAIQSCSLTSPLISPCSSFDEGLSTQKSKSSSVFGSSIIVSTSGGGAAMCNQVSPTRAAAALAPMLRQQPSATSVDLDSPSRATGLANATTGISLETRGDSRTGFLPGTYGRSEDHTVEHETHASSSSNGGRDDSLMLFDTAPENLTQAALVIRDFDPLDLDT